MSDEAYEARKLKAIGVSNFLKDDLESLLSSCKIKPMVNQVLCHVSNTPFDLIEYCQKEGILVEAYAPVSLTSGSVEEYCAKRTPLARSHCQLLVQHLSVEIPSEESSNEWLEEVGDVYGRRVFSGRKEND